ncbi:MAG: chromosome segregation protein SMC [Deltaproteobacteria bacterium]|nr:chromosome segregation protein SMC [Deltaproteobacteria bacterium]NIS76461.1 chromosome segregation protein SMC [Deltaproteobacteria bacterium]
MKIKSLELVGFKSFCEKTVVNFSEGVTAIVGPNGSGKSNVVDAIRWLMGETAPTMIRTKLLEDIIFSGSETSPPMGMAEVTLVFDNTVGPKPAGYESFSEIQITRRAFRDGESEFFINKTPCRLKDIVELSLDAGSGARGYCIIEQAKVQQIITGKPEETRMLIEEAAGVAKYRLRKKEALRKLETTRQNLMRVSDILLEVKRQLGSIDRQARKAKRYRVLKGEMKDMEIELLRRKAVRECEEEARLENLLRETAAKARRTEEILQAYKVKEQELRNAVFGVETEIESIRQKLSEKNESFYRLDTEHGAVTREIKNVSERISALNDAGRKIEMEMAELKNSIAGLLDAAGETDEQIVLFQSEHGEPAELRETLGRRLKELKQKQELKRDDLVDLLSRIGGFDNSISINEKWFSETDRKTKHLARELEQLQTEIARGEKQARDEIERERELTEKIFRISEESRELSASISHCEREVEMLKGNIEAMNKERERTDSRLNALKQILENYEVFGESVSYIMNEFRSKGEGADILGVLGELIAVEKGYERAVEAALGESLKYIIVKDADDGVVALRALKNTGKGRGAFAPVKLRKRDVKSVEIPAGEGVISSIAGIISAPAECRELIEDLLGDVLLVKTVEDAVRLWKTNGFWATYVTLEGDLVLPTGVISGGSVKGEERGILSKRREMAELEGKLLGAEKDLKNKENQLNVFKEELAEKRVRFQKLQAEIGAREKEKHSAKVHIEFLEKEIEKQKKRYGWSEEELAHLRAEMKRYETQNEETRIVKEKSAKKAADLEKEITVLKSAIQDDEISLRELEERTSRRDLEHMELKEQKRRIETEIESMRKIVEDKTAYRGKVAEEAGGLERGREGLLLRKEEMTVQLKAVADGREEFEKEMAEKSAQISGMKVNLSDVEKESADTASVLNNSKEEISSLREKLVAVRTRLESIHSVAHDSYGLEKIDPSPATGMFADIGDELLHEQMDATRRRLELLGEVNVSAIEERDELAKRYENLLAQKEDLEKSMKDLEKVISKIDRESRDKFITMFNSVNEKFMELFPKLFTGGKGQLKMTEEDNLLESGVEIIPQPPGKKLKNLALLSNGEKALTGICLLLSLFFVRPGPFLFLDEVDAPLDEANVDRFNRLIRDISHSCQVIMITHKKRTMELADFLYGTTMDRPGISRIISAQLS